MAEHPPDTAVPVTRAVTRAQVRALLDPSGGNRSLVLPEGRTEVVPTDPADPRDHDTKGRRSA